MEPVTDFHVHSPGQKPIIYLFQVDVFIVLTVKTNQWLIQMYA